jgi:hypothetical protein
VPRIKYRESGKKRARLIAGFQLPVAGPIAGMIEGATQMTTTQSSTRRNLFRIGAAAAVAVSVPVAAMATVGHGNDAELLAMLAESDARNAHLWELHTRIMKMIHELLPGSDSLDLKFQEAAKEPRIVALEREQKVLDDAAGALDERIRNFKPQTLEGTVAHAEFISGDDDFKEILLTNLRRIMEVRS